MAATQRTVATVCAARHPAVVTRFFGTRTASATAHGRTQPSSDGRPSQTTLATPAIPRCTSVRCSATSTSRGSYGTVLLISHPCARA